MNSDTQIAVDWQTLVPKEILSDLLSSLQSLSVPHETHESEPQIQMSLGDYVRTALVIYLAKPFFDGFLKEAGKDAYNTLKQRLASLFTKANDLPIVSVSSAGKLDNRHESSRIVSIYSVSADGLRLKFLFPKRASEQEHAEMIDSMFRLLEENHTKSPNRLSNLLPKEKRFLHVLRYSNQQWILLSRTTLRQ